MPRSPDSAQLDLAEVFYSVQERMLAQFAVGAFFEHPTASGSATERHWLDVLAGYLPKRYSAAPAFVIDSEGRRSRQIDIAIFDNLYSPLLFPHESGLHIPAESIYAVFEVKPTFSRQWIRDAGEKAASVRRLQRTSVRVMSGNKLRPPIHPMPIIAGILATTSVWTRKTFSQNLKAALAEPRPTHRLDLGCSLEHGSFEQGKKITVSIQEESLIFFILRLLERLRAQGTAPAADLMKYGRHLESFK
jgi:hypothetical protein